MLKIFYGNHCKIRAEKKRTDSCNGRSVRHFHGLWHLLRPSHPPGCELVSITWSHSAGQPQCISLTFETFGLLLSCLLGTIQYVCPEGISDLLFLTWKPYYDSIYFRHHFPQKTLLKYPQELRASAFYSHGHCT